MPITVKNKEKNKAIYLVDDFGDSSSSIAGFQTHVHQRGVGFEPVQKHQGGIEGGHRL